MYSLVLMAALNSGTAAPTTFFHHWRHGCHGCHGCWGGWGCHGCYGGCHGGWGSRSWGCHGCHGGWSHAGYACWGGAVVTPYPVVTPATVYAKPASPEPAEELAAPPKKKESESKVAPNRARLIVQVPADAKVYIDERPTKVANKATRVFLTPEIERGHDYYYVVRAEVTRDGKALVKSQRVIVRAGGEARASFRDLASSRTVATTAKE